MNDEAFRRLRLRVKVDRCLRVQYLCEEKDHGNETKQKRKASNSNQDMTSTEVPMS